MAYFLTQFDVYRLLQRELPEGVYPDGAPSAYFSTADMDSVANVAATGYVNLSRIYDNYFPQSAVEYINETEMKYFGALQDQTQSIGQRQQNLLTRIQQPFNLTRQAKIAMVQTIIGTAYTILIRVWNQIGTGIGDGGVWALGVSQLDIDSILGGGRMLDVTPQIFPGLNLCAGCTDPALFGKTQQQWSDMQEQAYTYEVRIYGYTPTAAQLTAINALLSTFECARSAHVITSGLNINDLPGGSN